jgi:uncharacterized protein YjeT (DUF2065 family)
MNWTNLGIGLSLVLVIEGLIPFVSPSRYHRMLEIASRLHERRLRLGGAGCMLAGVALLYLLN